MNLTKMRGQTKKSQSSKIGRRTGVNVVSGKKIREQVDGTEVFDDYWTDSDGENSIRSSQTSKSIYSPDRTRNVHSSKMLSTPDNARSSQKKIIKQTRNKFFDYSVDSSLESSKRLKDHRSRMTQTSYLLAETESSPSKRSNDRSESFIAMERKISPVASKRVKYARNITPASPKRVLRSSIRKTYVLNETLDLPSAFDNNVNAGELLKSNVKKLQNNSVGSTKNMRQNSETAVSLKSSSVFNEKELSSDNDSDINDAEGLVLQKRHDTSSPNKLDYVLKSPVQKRKVSKAAENSKIYGGTADLEQYTQLESRSSKLKMSNVSSPQNEIQDSSSEHEDVSDNEVCISPLKEMQVRATHKKEIQKNSVGMSPQIMGRSYTVSEKNVTNVSSKEVTRSYLEAIENKKLESSKKSKKGLSSGKSFNRKSSVAYVPDAYDNVANLSQVTSSPREKITSCTLNKTGILLSNDEESDGEASSSYLKTANSKRINSPEKSKQGRKSSMANVSYAYDNTENSRQITSSPGKALRGKITPGTLNETDNEENDREISSSETANSKRIDSPNKSKRRFSAKEPPNTNSNVGITSSRTDIASRTHSKRSILLPDYNEDTDDSEKSCREVSMSSLKKTKRKGVNRSDGKKEDCRMSFSVEKSPKHAADSSQLQNVEGKMSSRSSRKASRLEISESAAKEDEKVAYKRTSSVRKSPKASEGKGVQNPNSLESPQVSDNAVSPMKTISPVCKAKRKIIFPEATKGISQQDEAPLGNVRRSSRMRVPPLASWRNERLTHIKSPSGQFRAVVDKGLPEDDYVYRKLAKRLPENKVKKKEVGKGSRPKKTPIADLIRNKTVEVNIHRPFSAYEWVLPKNDECCGCMISRCFSSEAITFGFLDISVDGKKTPQFSPTDNIHFVIVKGSVDATVNETSFTFHRGDTFIVPMGTLYSLNNIGSSNALLSFCAFKIPFFQFQDDDD